MSRIAKVLALAAFVVVVGSAASASAANPTVAFAPTSVGCHVNSSCFIALPALVPALITSADAACGNLTQVRFLPTDQGADFMYKAALSAFLAGKKVVIGLTGTCVEGFPGASYVFITN
jgi:hypothetical protein